MIADRESRAVPADIGSERRRHRRLDLALPVACRQERPTGSRVVSALTRNVSTGGLYLELDNSASNVGPGFDVGEYIDVELTLSPSEGVSNREGRARSRAEIIRVQRHRSDGRAVCGVAARFLDRLRTSI